MKKQCAGCLKKLLGPGHQYRGKKYCGVCIHNIAESKRSPDHQRENWGGDTDVAFAASLGLKNG